MNMLVDRFCPTCDTKSWGEREEHYEPGPGSSGAWVRTWTCGMCKQSVVKRTKESYRYVQTPWGRMTRQQDRAIRMIARQYIILHSGSLNLAAAEAKYEYKEFNVEVDPDRRSVTLLVSVGRKATAYHRYPTTQLFIGVRGAVTTYDSKGKILRGHSALWHTL
jgi:hypothetical protein